MEFENYERELKYLIKKNENILQNNFLNFFMKMDIN